MKILQLIDSLDAGGAERMAVQLANELAVAGHDSFLCATRREGLLKQTIASNVHYVFASKKGKLGLGAVMRIRTFINTNSITIIHAHGTSFFTAVLIKLFLFKVKIVWHVHYGNAVHWSRHRTYLIAIFSRFFSGIVAVNHQLKSWCGEHLHCKNIVCLHNFVSSTALNTLQPESQLPGLPDKRIVHLANLRPDKDHLTLFKAFRKINNTIPNWTLLLVGQDFNDAYSHKLRERVRAYNLSNTIHFLGSRGDVEGILKQVAIGVLSSRSEGLPVALLEYGNAALPVVVTDVGACSDVVDKYGTVVEPADAKALHDALLYYMKNAKVANEHGTKFKHHVSSTFGATQYITKLVSFYNTLR